MKRKYDIIIVSGGFDPVHKGHVRMFESAREMAFRLVCGANSDKWLVNKKGKNFMNFDERSEILKAFEHVDDVVSFNDDDGTAVDLLRNIRALYPKETYTMAFANGGDRTKENTPENEFCKKNDIEMVWGAGGEKVQSSSDLIKNIE